ncbi:unnamed protein product [Trifolium pratense]|uniref:Uncharacterized protein n=1 Tax=Trifolium pratense TaxID=57577 RepID=A0ACB0KLI6_TRIPR|nr:unnamed protein product [Trifolium pratense]
MHASDPGQDKPEVQREHKYEFHMTMEVTQIQLNAQAVDGAVRKQAEDNLKQFQAVFMICVVSAVDSCQW